MPRQQTVSEQIAELQKKIALIEGDRKAFHQSAQFKLEKNQQKIQKLRKENKELHQQLAATLNADEEAINETFGEEREKEKPAFRGKSTSDAIRTMDNKKCDAYKRLEQQKYRTACKKRELDEVTGKIEQQEEDVRKAKDTEDGESDSARRKRELENSLQKSEMKVQEAKNVGNTYEKIVAQLEQEKLLYPKKFDEMKEEMEKNREELKTLKEMQTDAETSRDAAKEELARQEEQLKKEKREREEKLRELRKQAEEKKQQQDKMERRQQSRSAIQPESAGGGADAAGGASGEKSAEKEETEKKISTYEEAFQRIKEATGVQDTGEVVERFRTQDDTYNNLQQQKAKNADLLEKLAADKDKLKEEYTAMKYTGETKLSHGERTLEEQNNRLVEEEERKDRIEARLKESSQVLVNVKSGVEHLSIKVAHLKGTKSQEPKQTPQQEQDDYVLDMLMICEDKLQKLSADLGDNNTYDKLEEQVEHDSLHHMLEDKLPDYNTRVALPQYSKDGYEDESAGEDEEVQTRLAMKKASQSLVDAKTKRRPQKKKSKKK